MIVNTINTHQGKSVGKINSKKKGSKGELELAHFLSDRGFTARRGQQYQGTPDSPDIICESLNQYHIECKRVEKFRLYDSLKQARDDAGDDQTPVVFHRQNNKEWVVILSAEDWINSQKNVQ